MALEVIGSGFGRTGTRSLKEALEILGFGPCHHMEEVFANPGQVPGWVGALSGQPTDWVALYDGYRAQVDWPGAHVWRQVAAAHPQAKVIHSQRPDDSWWRSFSTTIGKVMRISDSLALPPHIRQMFDAALPAIGEGTFGTRTPDRDTALATYHRRREEVLAALPPERVLVFDVAEGWGPLCGFLGVPVPDTAFPHLNERADFWANFGGEPPD
ncbi:sulfotransferase family protein [Frigidibacter sp. MR17.24]|uniref:sulfotransferase family protein n=1 Tax=Frigidibacter sp. MR17.24 TaxID=3127345 RepID=UPI003012F7E6